MRQEHTTLDGVTKQQLLTKVVELLCVGTNLLPLF